MKKAYSYKRWSSPTQTAGDSFKRQMEAAMRVANEHGWQLVDLPPDAAVSAFKGKNLSHKGILGQFIAKVQRGDIPTPCVLILEKMDRFSRKNVDEVLPLFIDLIKSGVEVYSVFENYHYTQKELRDNPTLAIMQMVLGFVAANTYSRDLGKRISRARASKLEAVKAGKIINVGEWAPNYFTWSVDRYVPNQHSPVVQRIFDRYNQNDSLNVICRTLNAEKVPTFGWSKKWSAGVVKSMMVNRAVLGEFKGHKDYFPRLISDKVFERTQVLLAKNSGRRGAQSQQANIFRGVLKCDKCGANLHLQLGRERHHSRYYRCTGWQKGTCDRTHSVKVAETELEFFMCVLQEDPYALLGRENKALQKKQTAKKHELEAITNQITKVLNVMESMDIPELKNKLVTLNKSRDEIQRQLDELGYKMLDNGNTPNNLKKAWELLGIDDTKFDAAARDISEKLKDNDLRLKLQALIPTLISKIEMNTLQHTFKVFSHTGEIIAERQL